MVRTKLRAIWAIIRSSSAHLVLQKKPGDDTSIIAFGEGTMQDTMLIALAIKRMYNSFLDALQEMAVETGELHTLQQLKDAVEKMEAENGGQ